MASRWREISLSAFRAEAEVRPILLMAGERHAREAVPAFALPYTVLRYALHGSGEATIGGEHHQIRAGDLVCFRPLQNWQLRPTPGDTLHYCWIHLELLAPSVGLSWRQEHGGSLMEFQQADLHWERLSLALPTVFRSEQDLELETLLRRIVAAYQDVQATDAERSVLCHQVLLHLAAIYPRETRTEPGGKDAPALRKVLTHLRQHYTRPISLRELGEIACLHPVYLGSLFKREIGQTPIEYLNRLRIQAAEQRLREDPNRCVSTVAREVGFQSAAHFYRIFKRYTGSTPRASHSAPSHYAGANSNSLNGAF